MRTLRSLPLCAGLALTLLLPGAALAAEPEFGPAIKLKDANGQTEPRAAVAPDDPRYVITNGPGRDSVVHSSSDGGASWQPTQSKPANGARPTIDVDIVTTHTGRIIASELDFQAISFITSYSDDGGRTWKQSTGGSQTGDTDRQWLAVGPDDQKTHQPRVYLLYHDLAAGTAQHNMFVTTSTDGGATFGVPVPITLPPTEAYQDLQCSDSGGPSNLLVNPDTGRLYAVWGTRTAPVAGGCGASVFGPFEVNVVGATRVWTATSPDNSPGSWTTSLAVDDSTKNAANGGKEHLVGMQLAPGALDSAGNLTVAYPESPNAYPDYNGAAIKAVTLPPDLSRRSTPVTIAPAGGAGHVLPHIVAGDPGKFDFAYFTGVERPGLRPAWYMTVAQTLDNGAHVTEKRLSNIPTYTGTASELMGACGSGPEQGVQNGFVCTRSTDVWGVALDNACRLTTTWPTKDNNAYAVTQKDPAFAAPGSDPGTFVATQTGGPAVCTSLKRPTGPAVGAGGKRVCQDRTAPVSRFDRHRTRLTRRALRLRGRSSDRGCAATASVAGRSGKVRRVRVSIARALRDGRCRFMSAKGRFGKPRSCARTLYVSARGATRWQLSKRVHLPRGAYKFWVRGIDSAGNVEHKRARVNFLRLRVK